MALLLMLSGLTLNVQAQQGFGTNEPAPSSVVDMTASDKGVLLPRVNLRGTTDIVTIVSPAPNLLVFNTATAGTAPDEVTPGFYYWNGSLWMRLLSKSDAVAGWTLKGNAGTNPVDNYVGTNDEQDIAFKTNGTERLRVTAAGGVGIGTNEPNANALLDLNSTTQGFLPPRLDATQLTNIKNPVEGLIVYNTTLRCLAYYTKGAFTCAFAIPGTRSNGVTFTVFYNGWKGEVYTEIPSAVNHSEGEPFSSNAECVSNPISTTGCGGATVVTGVKGEVYALTEINGQCWMAQNIREAPSIDIPLFKWPSTEYAPGEAWGYYNTVNENGAAGWGNAEIRPADPEGMLFQWRAAMNGIYTERSQGVCPDGFHIPSDCEFMYLEHGLGMKVVDQSSGTKTLRGDGAESIGSKLTKDGGFNNASGFSALFAGKRMGYGSFTYNLSKSTASIPPRGYWWTSTVDTPEYTSTTDKAYNRSIEKKPTNGNLGVSRTLIDLNESYSVRCLKD